MRYSKPPLKLDEQIRHLRSRGLGCDDDDATKHYFRQIGYHRLKQYWLPFIGDDGHFHADTTFADVLALYIFDRKLRLLVMEAFEHIEIAVRSHWSNGLAERYGSHAYLQASLFKSATAYETSMYRIKSGLSNIDGYIDYQKKYREPTLPPIWVAVELMSLGTLSKWLENTKSTAIKRDIARQLGMPASVDVLEQVLHALTPVRNISAHHARLWNRRFVLRLPLVRHWQTELVSEILTTSNGEVQRHVVNLLYNFLVVMRRLLQVTSPQSSWPQRLAAHIHTAPLYQQRMMGFPEGWNTLKHWR